MDFIWAAKQLEQGKPVRRKSWGLGEYVGSDHVSNVQETSSGHIVLLIVLASKSLFQDDVAYCRRLYCDSFHWFDIFAQIYPD